MSSKYRVELLHIDDVLRHKDTNEVLTVVAKETAPPGQSDVWTLWDGCHPARQATTKEILQNYQIAVFKDLPNGSN